jgi:hypothetical protein
VRITITKFTHKFAARRIAESSQTMSLQSINFSLVLAFILISNFERTDSLSIVPVAFHGDAVAEYENTFP